MKKIAILTFAFCACLGTFAQNNKEVVDDGARLGFKGGVNLSKFRADDLPDYLTIDTKFKTSFNGGVFIHLPLGMQGFSVQPEVMYSREGSKMKLTTSSIVTTTTSYEQELHYINMPVMFQWKSAAGFFVEAGPQAGYLLKAKQTGLNNSDKDNKGDFEKFNLAAAGGLGFLSKPGLGINARYVYGFSNLLDNESDNSSFGNIKLKQSTIQLGLFWKF